MIEQMQAVAGLDPAPEYSEKTHRRPAVETTQLHQIPRDPGGEGLTDKVPKSQALLEARHVPPQIHGLRALPVNPQPPECPIEPENRPSPNLPV